MDEQGAMLREGGCAEWGNEGARPLVSVIVPVYNSKDHLQQCLDSIFAQSYGEWELICVDDGSTDGSADILRENAARCARMRILGQENSGPGRARNNGLGIAQGRYVLFVDSDDFIAPDLLEKAVARAEETEADIVIWDMWFYNQRHSRLQHPPMGIFHFDRFDNGDKVFSYKDNPDWIFLSFQNYPWNKLFRLSLVKEKNLQFQEDVLRTEDLLFVCSALIEARRIACLRDRLSCYRVLRAGSAMATKDRTPFDFHRAFLALREWLVGKGVYGEVERSYVTWALSSALYNLHTFNVVTTFKEVYAFLRDGGLRDLGVKEFSPDYYLIDGLHASLKRIESLSAEEYLFDYAKRLDLERDDTGALMDFLDMDLRAQLAEERGRVRALAAEVEDCRRWLNAAEYKVGKAICRIPRAVQRAVLRARGKDCGAE